VHISWITGKSRQRGAAGASLQEKGAVGVFAQLKDPDIIITHNSYQLLKSLTMEARSLISHNLITHKCACTKTIVFIGWQPWYMINWMAKLEITKRIRFPLYRGFQPQINLPPEGGSRAVQCTTGMLPPPPPLLHWPVGRCLHLWGGFVLPTSRRAGHSSASTFALRFAAIVGGRAVLPGGRSHSPRSSPRRPLLPGFSVPHGCSDLKISPSRLFSCGWNFLPSARLETKQLCQRGLVVLRHFLEIVRRRPLAGRRLRSLLAGGSHRRLYSAVSIVAIADFFSPGDLIINRFLSSDELTRDDSSHIAWSSIFRFGSDSARWS
jgi:hypothetical protein